MPTYLVIGDDYEKITDKNISFSFTDFCQKILENPEFLASDTQVILGQGLSAIDREFLSTKIEKIGNVRLVNPISLATLSLTHKVSLDNILISSPKKTGNKEYTFDLIIGDKIDRLSDHVTGLHIGAMLIMEAGRQATIAILELTYCNEDNDSYGLILDRFDSQFSEYLFPLPTTLRTVVHQHSSPEERNISTTVEVFVIQTDQQVGLIKLHVTLCSKKVLNKIEEKKSKIAINKLVKIVDDETAQFHSVALAD